MTVINNARIIEPGKGVVKGSVAFQGPHIVEADSSGPQINADGLYVSPGFLDMHMHGGFGFDFFACKTVDELREALRLNALDGVTGVMPTTSGSEDISEEKIAQLSMFNSVMQDTEGPELMGVHYEGPYFPAELAPGGREVLPNLDNLTRLLDAAPCIKRMSIAPEIKGGLEAISILESRGVASSLGHCAPGSAEIKKAIKAGSRQVTHLYSGMKGVYRDESSVRHPGLIELAYLFDELAVELIANGKHMDIDLLKLVYKIKGADGIFIVTDSHPRDFSLRGDKSQYVLLKRDPADGKNHFNTATPIPEMLRIMTQEVEVPIFEAVKMVTATPARLMHVEDRKGRLVAGYDADIVAFDEDFNIKLVVARGKQILCDI